MENHAPDVAPSVHVYSLLSLCWQLPKNIEQQARFTHKIILISKESLCSKNFPQIIKEPAFTYFSEAMHPPKVAPQDPSNGFAR
ncbi:MAG: hypothetical protein A3H79_04075 [Candidatus Levybacteria bacterium RIFCSPLOWO2_02_FULL_36_8b]|nr:MAG: hypothetical protein A3H79_04075 [Candidatus Levybacteria bacterium RIFCSPLOWO2_02_FULL_36_8b]